MKVVIIGGVAGGMSAATRLRRLDESAEIVVLEKSGFVSYANCGLPYYVGGVISKEEALLLQTPASLHARFKLDVRVNTEVVTINRAAKFVETKSGEKISYDKLILSPGAKPVQLPISGIEKALTLRTVEDVKRIHDLVAKKPKTAVVIGGGFIGLEMAENLVHQGIKTTLIEALPQVLGPLDPELATFVEAELIKHGVEVKLNAKIDGFFESSIKVDGIEIPAELVISAVGVKPDIELAKSADIQIGERGGIAVNDFNQTSDPEIYAIGDVAEKKDSLDGTATLVPLANLANRHGRIVSDHILGRKVRVVPTIATAIVKVFDLTIATTGWGAKKLKAAGRDFAQIHTHPNHHAGYYPGSKQISLKLIFDPKTGEIFGAQGVGAEGVDKRIDVIATAIRGGITAPELADLELAYAPPFGSAKDPINMLGYIAENVISGLTQTVQWSELEEYANAGYEFIDVRTASEFERGTIPNSKNISVDDLRARYKEITNKNVIVNCQVGQRGHTATLLLNELGFNAKNLDGGYLTWKNSPANPERKK